VECRNTTKKEYGIDGLTTSIMRSREASAAESVNTIVCDIRAHVGAGRQRDDATLMLIEVR